MMTMMNDFDLGRAGVLEPDTNKAWSLGHKTRSGSIWKAGRQKFASTEDQCYLKRISKRHWRRLHIWAGTIWSHGMEFNMAGSGWLDRALASRAHYMRIQKVQRYFSFCISVSRQIFA